MAEVPAPTLIGVEGVVVTCDFDSRLTADQRRTLCAQLVRKAQAATSLPVRATTSGSAANLADLAKQLLLQIIVKATPVGNDRLDLQLAVTPVRLGVKQGQVGGLQSTVTLVRAGKEWAVQGHVDAFQKLLGGAPRRLHGPITSDR